MDDLLTPQAETAPRQAPASQELPQELPQERPRIAFTVGDVNGISIEVLVKGLARPELLDICRPVIVGNCRLLRSYIQETRMEMATVHEGELDVLGTRFPVVEVESDGTLMLGQNDARAGKLAGDAIIRAARMVSDNEADAIVTMPISKRALNAGGHDFPGHTEMLASLVGGEPLMMLMTEGLRVAIVTIHVPLREVPEMLTWQLVETRARALHDALRNDFGVAEPRIAVLGLNPHAGEEGIIGREEIEVIAPTIQRLHAAGLGLDGPLSADGFFARFSPGEYDAVLAMYHDQGLIPLKLLARGAGVNYTAGLPIVRTSPDHGTAYGITGLGMANEQSVVEATQVAVEVVGHRRNNAKRVES